MKTIIDKIKVYSLEEIMGDRFGKYAKEIIQDRAIPDIRDGLKPVQRRILYAMYKTNNIHNKPYIKCASTVGEVLGKYHPHGDSSVYDAMIRLSQWWKQNHILVDVHGNNGSIDGDSAAAYRYTESRLAKISSELLKDIEKDTVAWSLNFDDRFLEPTVLPAKFPNLLVNGASGISAGYATNIPPHNLGEIIDATIKRIDSPNCRLETILDIVKGPDFPTGGIVEGIDEIKKAFETGKGRVIVRSTVSFEKIKGKDLIVATEIPYDVNKANLVSKIDAIRIDKKIDGIQEVRDETDRDGIRVVVELKRGVDKELVLNYLYKNTELQSAFNYNMVSIVNRRPYLLGILPMLDAYIEFQKEVITNRTQFDLEYFKKRYHIVEGLIKAISILDEVIATIRKSKNKNDAKNNLVKEYDFTMEQAEAIVMLQLYKLTNTDVTELEEEMANLAKAIKGLEDILNDPEILKSVMKLELRKVKKEYSTPRKTIIKDEVKEINIDEVDFISEEDVYLVLSKEGYIKKVSERSFNSSEGETGLRPGDYVLNSYKVNNKEIILIFTSLGNYLYLPIYDIPDARWKDLGKHISNIILLAPNEEVVGSVILNNLDDNLFLFTKQGQVKKVLLKDFQVSRYSKSYTAINLNDSDELINVSNEKDDLLFVTNNGMYLRFKKDLVNPVGPRAKGVIGINLDNDVVVYATSLNDDEYLNLFTNFNTGKRVKITDLTLSNRANKGSTLFKKVKSKDYKINFAFTTKSKDVNLFVKNDDITEIKNSDITINDLISTGSNVISSDKIVKKDILQKFVVLEDEEEITEKVTNEKEQISFDDFVEDFKIK